MFTRRPHRPTRPSRFVFIVPYAPGGSTSQVARLVADKMTESWGQQVLVDNRGGANTVIGTDALAKSAPDGYTIALHTSTLATLQHLLPRCRSTRSRISCR